MNERTHFFIKICISHTLFSKGLMFLWCVRDGWRDIYSERGLLLSISFSRSQGVPTLAPPLQARQRRLSSAACPTLDCDSLPLSKSDRVVLITWSPSSYTPVRPECPVAPSSPCLPIKMWQLTKAHGVTRNAPKIHVICYITCYSPRRMGNVFFYWFVIFPHVFDFKYCYQILIIIWFK